MCDEGEREVKEEEGLGNCYLICVKAEFSTCRCNKARQVR